MKPFTTGTAPQRHWAQTIRERRLHEIAAVLASLQTRAARAGNEGERRRIASWRADAAALERITDPRFWIEARYDLVPQLLDLGHRQRAPRLSPAGRPVSGLTRLPAQAARFYVRCQQCGCSVMHSPSGVLCADCARGPAREGRE